jgi:HK97 family phage major capsid protein
MATIDELISSIEVELEAEQKREQKARAEIKLMIETAGNEGRSNLSEEEDKRSEDLFAAVEGSKEAQAGIKRKLANATKVKAEEAEAEARARETRETPVRRPKYDEVARVGKEERTYHKGNDPSGDMFIRDVCHQFLNNDVSAGTRLARHMHEERVERPQYFQRAAGDLATTALGGLVVPQFLVDMTAPAVANLRPFADVCNHHILPDQGMTVTIPKITTATSAALQATQLTGVSATSLAETDLNVSVQTAAGQQNVSRQALDRGYGIGDVVLQDLFKRYATVLDNTLINQATNGLDAVSVTNTYTSGSPTGTALFTKVVGAMSGVEAALLAMGRPTHVIMHSRRWYWLQSQLTSTWPLVNMGGDSRVGGSANEGSSYASGIRGQLPNGLGVVVDNNVVTNLGVGTNQDRVYVVPQDECHLWKQAGQPAFIRAEQPNSPSLGVLLVVYGYFAYTFARYSSIIQNIDGTGLVTPAF